jgi:hypothetical protein
MLGQMLQGQSMDGFTNDYPGGAAACVFQGKGPDRVYAVDVPAQSMVVVTAQASGSGDLGLAAMDAPVAECISPPWCIASSDLGGGGEPESIEVDNKAMTPRTVFIVVSEAAGPASGETFSLSASGASLTAAPPGDTCDTAIFIDAGTLTAETTAGFYDDVDVPNTAVGCNSFTTVGRDRLYAINVAPGQTLSATLTPAAAIDGGVGYDPALFLLNGLAACQRLPTSCLDGSDFGLSGEAESVSYLNDGGTPVNVLILVDSYFTEPIPSYTLQTTLTP